MFTERTSPSALHVWRVHRNESYVGTMSNPQTAFAESLLLGPTLTAHFIVSEVCMHLFYKVCALQISPGAGVFHTC